MPATLSFSYITCSSDDTDAAASSLLLYSSLLFKHIFVVFSSLLSQYRLTTNTHHHEPRIRRRRWLVIKLPPLVMHTWLHLKHLMLWIFELTQRSDLDYPAPQAGPSGFLASLMGGMGAPHFQRTIPAQ
jgi:hypothetical protein